MSSCYVSLSSANCLWKLHKQTKYPAGCGQLPRFTGITIESVEPDTPADLPVSLMFKPRL